MREEDLDPRLAAIDQYDAIAVRREIHDSAIAFVDRMTTLWRGEKDRFHRVVAYDSYLRNFFISGASAAAAGVVAAETLGADVSLAAAAAGGALLLVSGGALYAFVRKSIAHVLDLLDHALYHEAEDHIFGRLYERMQAHIGSLQIGGKSLVDADAAAMHILGIERQWRELERIPHYLSERWYAYRLEIREARDLKFIVALIVLAATTIGTLTLYYRWPIDSLLPAIAAACFVAGSVAYMVIMDKRLRKFLEAINAGLRIGARLVDMKVFATHAPVDGGAEVEDDANWRVRIARMDPSVTLAGNYRTLLAMYIRITGPR